MSTLAPDYYRDKDCLAREIAEHGSAEAASRAHGPAASTLKRWCARFDIQLDAQSGTRKSAPSPGAAVSEVDVLQQENRELHRRLEDFRKRDIVDHRVIRTLEQNVLSLEPRYEPAIVPEASDFTPHRFVLLWSDLHAAERVNLEQMNGINEYDWEIMLARHRRMTRAIVSFQRNRAYPVEGLNILGLGDMLSGDIHDELRITNEKVILEAAVQLGYDAAEWVADLVPHFPFIEIDGVVGNHPRLTKKPSFKDAFNNFDWLVYQIMKLRLREYPSVTVRVPKAPETVVTIGNRRILAFHGDGIRTSMPGVPWGGVDRKVKELSQTYAAIGLPIDYFALGHWHEANVVRQKRIWMNGSVKGQDEYSLGRFGGGNPACQVLLSLHPTRGVTDVSFLDINTLER